MSALGNQFKTMVLFALLTAVLLFIGRLVGGNGGLVIAFVIVIIMNFISYFFSHKIVLAMYRAKEIKRKDDPNFYDLVKGVADLADIPMPKLYIIPSETPNAFATGRNPKNAAVACTNGIMKLLSRDELKGVIAHEIAHVKNRDILIATIAATIAGVISYVASMARWAAIFGGRDGEGNNLLSFLLLAIVTPIVALIIQLAISRSREYLADETGAKMINNPTALANALAKLDQMNKHHPMQFGNSSSASLFIVNPFSGRSFISLLSTHPPMKKRIQKLKALD